MTPEALARLHARAFPAPPRPWSAPEFAQLLASPGVALFCDPAPGFLLARCAGPEIEVLTLCVAPESRRSGCARKLLKRLEEWAFSRNAEDILLEVSDTNAPARALYAAAGFAPRGYRKDYYTAQGRSAVSAHVLGKSLR
ncbi:GNAT family N-acetyltransferase [Oceanibium sediminis]|uniref:GNAT family N-acetyltransferase n=1 Tax=Oceanibium sediminis TaxID=2026339 RepID=UPI000DD3A144|nr:GNAT family N-acetyltransferase [Oceanibium sediminis]